MKRLLTYVFLPSLLFCSVQDKALAQVLSVSLSSTGNCTGNTLTVNSNLNPAQIVWKQNGTVVQTTNAVFTSSGVTVAGGNGAGIGANQLYNPFGVYVDASGNVYVSDHDNNRVQKWTPGATSGTTVAGQSSGASGSATSQLALSNGVFVDGSNNVYVADYNNFRVMKWAPGASNGVVVAGSTGGSGAQLSYVSNAYGVFVDAAGNVYVGDAINNRVVKWAPGATAGVIVAGGNGPGSAANKLDAPQGFWVDPSGNVYIADVNNQRIQKWAPGALSGTTVAGGNGQGLAANQLYNPSGVYADAAGNVYVADFHNNRIQLWTPGATSGITVAGDSACNPGNASNRLQYPTGVYVDNNGNIYVSDRDNDRVQKFTPSTSITNTFTPSVPGSYTATVYSFDGQNATTFPVTIGATPTITYGASPVICAGAGSADLSYTATGNPLTYSVNYDLAALAAGFSNILNAGLSSSPIVLNVPGVSPSVYHGSITVASTGGCTTTADNFTITVNANIAPSIIVSSSVSDTVCAGTQVAFSTIISNGGSSPVYQWYINGNPVWINSPTFSTSTLNNGDIVSCTLTSNGACVTTTAASSNSIHYTINPIPSVDTVFDQSACSGVYTSLIQFSGSVVSGTSYVWTHNNTSIGIPVSFGVGDINPFVANDTSGAALMDTFTVTPIANSCNGPQRTFRITIYPTPVFTSGSLNTPPVCSGTLFAYIPATNVPLSGFKWSRALVPGISNPAASGTGSPNEVLNNISGSAVPVIYVDTLTAFGCTNIQKDTVIVNPAPPVPVIDIKPSSSIICSNNAPLSFGTSIPAPSGGFYTWSVSNAAIWGLGSGNQNVLVSFPYTGISVVTLSSYYGNTLCQSTITDTLTVNGAVVTNAGVIYHSDQFICLDNKAVSYQWGYDDAHTLVSTPLQGQVNQSYINPSPDYANKYYWVIVVHEGCVQKIYYNAPTGIQPASQQNGMDMKIYPNPATDILNVDLDNVNLGKAEVHISDITGKTIAKALMLNNRCSVNIHDLSPGFYIISAYSDHTILSTGTFIKN